MKQTKPLYTSSDINKKEEWNDMLIYRLKK